MREVAVELGFVVKNLVALDTEQGVLGCAVVGLDCGVRFEGGGESAAGAGEVGVPFEPGGVLVLFEGGGGMEEFVAWVATNGVWSGSG